MMRASALLALAFAGVAQAGASDYRLQLQDGATYRLASPELAEGADDRRRQARREALSTLPFAALIERAAEQGGIEPELLHAVVRTESAYNPHAVSPKGALGLAQLMPSTALAYGVSDALKPADNLRAGARHLRDLLDHFGDVELALSAYNAGAGAVKKYGGMPPFAETRAYVPRVSGHYEALKKLGDAAEPPLPASPYRLRADSAESRLPQSRN